jgi:hypothetical protein
LEKRSILASQYSILFKSTLQHCSYSRIKDAGSKIEPDDHQNIEDGVIEINGDMATCTFKRPVSGNDDDDKAGSADKPCTVLAPTDPCTRTGDDIDKPTNVEPSPERVCPPCAGKYI